MRLLVDSVRDYAIFMLDVDGKVVTWNAGAEQIKGYREDEIVGRSFTLFYTPSDLADGRPYRLLREAAEHGRVEDIGWRVRKDGSQFWADVVITALREDDGRLRGYAKVTRDLSDRRQMEEQLRHSEERLRLLIEGVHDYAIYMLDPDGVITTWNVGAERIKQCSAADAIGSHVSRFYADDDDPRAKGARELETAAREGRFEEEGWRMRCDGSRFWANVVITAIHDRHGHLVGFAQVTRDLTERRKLEDERLRLAHAEEALRLRDEFLAIASHELKTPLTALHLQLEGLRLALGEAPLIDRVDRVSRSSKRLGALIDTLLDVSRIATGKFTLSRELGDLGPSIRAVADDLAELATRGGCAVTVTVDGPLVGHWDRGRLEQVVRNVLANAIKYGPSCPIELEATRDGDEAVIAVCDRGPGIAAEDLDRIFERFERASSMRHHAGLGLGLYVAREIVSAHGGRITAERRDGGGARFVIRLPLAAAAADRPARPT